MLFVRRWRVTAGGARKSERALTFSPAACRGPRPQPGGEVHGRPPSLSPAFLKKFPARSSNTLIDVRPFWGKTERYSGLRCVRSRPRDRHWPDQRTSKIERPACRGLRAPLGSGPRDRQWRHGRKHRHPMSSAPRHQHGSVSKNEKKRDQVSDYAQRTGISSLPF